MDIISVVLGADTKKDRTKDSIKIIEYAYSNYQMVDMGFMLHDKFDYVVEHCEFNVNKGVSNNVKIQLGENNIGYYPVNKDDIKDIDIKTELNTNLKAPIYEGDIIRKCYYKD